MNTPYRNFSDQKQTPSSDKTAEESPRHLVLPIGDITLDPNNPRKHSRAQIRAIAKSISAFGFTAPILIDRNNKIVSGHGRYEAAKLVGLTHVPVIFLDHLTETQAKAYMLADNKLTDRSTWDDSKLAALLKELSELVPDFDIEATGFEAPEIDFRIQALDSSDASDIADEFEPASGPAVSVVGDLWLLGDNRLLCGSAVDLTAYPTLMNTQKAAAVFTDPPYNCKIDGHVSGKGNVKHREFPMASGEMTEQEFVDFLTATITSMCAYTTPGAILYVCIDWRNVSQMHSAGRTAGCDQLNLCVWVKSNAGMGSLYRSRHELVCVFRNGKQQHLNNVQLGTFGRHRTNVWNYPGANSFARKGSKRVLELHPTVKPIALVSDAILDCTKRNDIVLDPFIGSGTTLLAAERTARRCFGIELDPLYVDTTVMRWQRISGRTAQNINGGTFAELKSARGNRP